MSWNRPLIVVVILGLIALSWWRLKPHQEDFRRTQLLMGTVVEIVAEGQPRGDLNQAIDAAFFEMSRLDKLLSSYNPESDISRLSRSAEGGIIAPEVAEVIALGLDVAQRSQGAFDITLGRLKALWNFEQENPAIPKRDEITKALLGIGPGALTLNGLKVEKRNAELMIDLGGVAKGYVIDRAIAVLREHGVANAAINAGGDMYLLGQRLGRPWRIGIQHPRSKNDILATVAISDLAIVSSGDYERFFEYAGQRYHHIFDPKTGMPGRLCQSVSVIASSVALADALATALFVLGPDAGLNLLKEYPGAEGLIISADGNQYTSAGWLDFQENP